MINLISRTINHIKSLLKKFQLQHLVAVFLVVLMTLNTDVTLGQNNQLLRQKVREDIHQDDSQRPKTIREWNQEARETADYPGKRLQKIGEESAEAFKEFGSGYVEGAKKTARDVQNGAAGIGK